MGENGVTSGVVQSQHIPQHFPLNGLIAALASPACSASRADVIQGNVHQLQLPWLLEIGVVSMACTIRRMTSNDAASHVGQPMRGICISGLLCIRLSCPGGRQSSVLFMAYTIVACLADERAREEAKR